MGDGSHRAEEAEVTEAQLERRQLLGMLGVGGLALLAPAIAEASATPAASAATPAPPCPPSQPCPNSTPPGPSNIDTSKLPSLGQLIAALGRHEADARQLRRDFNKCPDKFLRGLYKLTDADVATLLDFKPDNVFLHIADQLPSPPSANGTHWKPFLKLVEMVDGFWDGWPAHPIKDCFDDPSWCVTEMSKSYAYPKTFIKNVDHSTDSTTGVTTLTVTAEGVVAPYTPELFQVDDTDTPVPMTDVIPDPQSTFRCFRLTAKAKLQAGVEYFVRITIAQTLKRDSDKFSI